MASPSKSSALSRLLQYFLRGCIVLAPLGATLYVLWWVLSSVDRILPLGIPGLGFVLTVGLVTLAGFLASSVLGSSLVELAERQLARVPLVKLVYYSIKDLLDAFVGDKKRFDRPVAVQLFPGSEARALGFVTRDSLEFCAMPALVGVYLPQSYNFAGNLLLVRRDLVEPLDVESGDLMTFIVSGGVSGFGRAQPGPTPSIPPLELPPPPRPPSASLDDGPTTVHQLDDDTTEK